MEGFTTGPHHIKLTWGDFLPVPGPIVAQRHLRAMLNAVDAPQRASRCEDQPQCIRAHDALPLATLILPQPIEGVGIANFNVHRPAVAILG